MAEMVRVGLHQSQEPGASFLSLTWLHIPKHKGQLLLFSRLHQQVAGLGSGAAETWTGALGTLQLLPKVLLTTQQHLDVISIIKDIHTLSFFFLRCIYLKESHRWGEAKTDPPAAGSLPMWSQQTELGQVIARNQKLLWVFHMGGRSPGSCAIFHYFSQDSNRKLDWK